MDALTTFHNRYKTETQEVVIRGRRFSFLVPAELEMFIDPDDIFHDFPLWSKVWEASLVLADFLAGMTPQPEKRFLEIGAGIGLVGIVAAAFGHRMTITEINSQALDFIRANSLINQCATVEIAELDWNSPGLEGGFDYIVGSEVVYNEKDFDPLRNLFHRLLRPGGEMLLCSEVRKVTLDFYRQLQPLFKMSAQKKRIRSQDQEIPVILCRIESTS
ncbi:MAG: methyltransferase [Thermodesulfobacteriota bacterium]